MIHYFDTRIARLYGLKEAVIFETLHRLCLAEQAHHENFHDGSYWVHGSIKTLAKIFDYMSEKQVRTAVRHLIDSGLIKTGNFNTSAYDHTLWYTLTEKGESILLSEEMPEGEK